MAGKILLGVVNAAVVGGALAYSKRDELKRSEAWRRADAALHVLRGRPLVWRVNLVAPPVINLAGGQNNVRVTDVNLNGATCLQMER